MLDNNYCESLLESWAESNDSFKCCGASPVQALKNSPVFLIGHISMLKRPNPLDCLWGASETACSAMLPLSSYLVPQNDSNEKRVWSGKWFSPLLLFLVNYPRGSCKSTFCESPEWVDKSDLLPYILESLRLVLTFSLGSSFSLSSVLKCCLTCRSVQSYPNSFAITAHLLPCNL